MLSGSPNSEQAELAISHPEAQNMLPGLAFLYTFDPVPAGEWS